MAILALMLYSGVASADPPPGFGSERQSLPPLTGARTWILQGEKLPSGGCSYPYATGAEKIPGRGWTLRSIALDPDRCRKLMEEGTPTAFSDDSGPGIGLVTETVSGDPAAVKGADPSASTAAVAATKGAWQRVIWRDAVGILTTAVVTQINWTFNGATVSGGSTTGAWQFNTATKWKLDVKSLTQLYCGGASCYRGQATATFSNSFFCAPLPVVYTYYYYKRVWGHANGTSTRSQSSDPQGECLPLHIDIELAYGQWSP